MTAYIARRILLMFPTLLGILFVSFVVVQFAPGGPVERVLLERSYHVATQDYDKQLVFDRTVEFARRVTA